MRKMTRIDGHVWCDRHGTVHDDNLDPYEYGEEGKCQPEDHSALYAWLEEGS